MSDSNKAKFPDDWNDNVFDEHEEKNSPGSQDDLPEIIRPRSRAETKTNAELEAGFTKQIAKKEQMKSHRAKMAAIRQFVQALNEISPLVDAAAFDIENQDDFNSKIGGLFALQGMIVGIIGDQWELDSGNINDKYILSLIAKQTSNLIKDGTIEEIEDKEKILAVLDSIEDFVKERPYIGQLIEEDQLSEDILVNVKTSLFPASLRFHTMMKDLGFSNSSLYKWVKWHNQMTVNLAKDLAFNWDRSASFRDREKLFENSLSYCASIAHDVWVDHFGKNISTKLTSYDDISLWSRLSDFESSVKECDMGYLSHDIYSMDWLKHKVCEHIVNLASQLKSMDISKIDSYKLQLYFVDKYCEKASEAWDETSKNVLAGIQEMLESMSEEEQQKWFEEEGSKPMPLSKFFLTLEEMVGQDIFESKSDLNEMSLLKDCKGKLAMIWGLSDAVCKIKRKDDE